MAIGTETGIPLFRSKAMLLAPSAPIINIKPFIFFRMESY